MVAQLSDALQRAALNDRERRVIARIVDALRAELGPGLLAVWLYGSRARGEADPTETHHDRRSDIDMIVIVDSASGWRALGGDVVPIIEAAAGAEGDTPTYYSVLVYEADRLRERRRVRSFFIGEVDRDKIVLAGSALEGPEYL
jgi:predicted nucleotidyltransferase